MLRVPRRAVVAIAVVVTACGQSETPTVAEPAPSRATTDAAPRRTSAPTEASTPPAIDALLADLRSDDSAVAARARAAVVASGQAAVDALVAWLAIADEDDWRPNEAVHLLPQFGHAAVPGAMRLLGHASADVRRHAIEVLRETRGFWTRADDGPDVARALFRLWDDPDDSVRGTVSDTLLRCAPATGCLAGELVARVLAPDARSRVEGLDVLAMVGDAASPFAPRLAALLADDDMSVRVAAEDVLKTLGASAATALPQIAALLEKGTAAQRASALGALEGMGDAAAPIAPTLIKLLGDEDENVRCGAAYRLGALGAAGPEVVDALARAFERPGDVVRDNALEALEAVAKDCPARRDDVARLLRTGSKDLRTALLFHLCHGNLAPWTPDVVACLSDPDAEIRCAAVTALASLEAPERSAVDACAAATSDADLDVRLAAVRAVHRWNKDAAKPSIDAITALLASDDADVRRGVFCTLAEVAPDVARFRAALRDADQDVRKAAVKALGDMGVAAAAAVPELTAALADADVAGEAAEALAKMGVSSRPVVDALARAAASTDNYHRRDDFLAALRRLGPAAASAAPAVAALAGEFATESAVASTLLAIDPDRGAAIETLLGTTKSPQEKIAALAALGADGAPGVLRAAVGDMWGGPGMARKALKGLGDAAARAILAATRSPDAALRTVAVGCLDLVDRTAALRALDAACADVSARVRGDAAETASRLAYAGVEVAPLAARLIAMLSDDDVRARTCAARAVGRLGAAGADSVPRLRALLADGPLSTRAAAGAAVHRLTGDVDGVLPVFAAILRAPADPDADDAWAEVGWCVASIGPPAASLADTMGSALLRSHSLTASAALLDALATFGPAAAPALPGVRAALAAELPCGEGDDGWIAVVHAVPVVAAIGPAAAPALRELRAQKGSPEFEAAVADAIRKITAPR